MFRLHTPSAERYDVALSVPGEHNIQNAAGALAAVHLLGLDLGAAAAALTDFPRRRAAVAAPRLG